MQLGFDGLNRRQFGAQKKQHNFSFKLVPFFSSPSAPPPPPLPPLPMITVRYSRESTESDRCLKIGLPLDADFAEYRDSIIDGKIAPPPAPPAPLPLLLDAIEFVIAGFEWTKDFGGAIFRLDFRRPAVGPTSLALIFSFFSIPNQKKFTKNVFSNHPNFKSSKTFIPKKSNEGKKFFQNRKIFQIPNTKIFQIPNFLQFFFVSKSAKNNGAKIFSAFQPLNFFQPLKFFQPFASRPENFPPRKKISASFRFFFAQKRRQAKIFLIFRKFSPKKKSGIEK